MYNEEMDTPEGEDLSAIDEFIVIENPIESPDDEVIKTGCELLMSYFNPINFEGHIKYVPRGNITDKFSEILLKKAGVDLIEAYQTDCDSMSDWNKLVNLGLKLVEQEPNGRSDPWDNASNFKSPLLQQSALEFSDRTSTELLIKDELVKTQIYGKKTDEKEAIADRLSIYLNYKLDTEMEEWRDEQEKLIYALPYCGTMFKKVYFDPMEGRITSKLISFPNFAVDNQCSSFHRLRRFSDVFELSKSEIVSRMRSNIWRDIELNHSEEDSNEAPNDKYQVFIEMNAYYDLDEDGYEEPYTFFIHKESNEIVRIIPRFSPHKAMARLKDKPEIKEITLSQASETNLDDYEVVRIKANNDVVMYGFLHDPDGGLLNKGYCHLLASLTQAINATTNQLLDAGTLANLQGGFMAKNSRVKAGDLRMKPGSWQQTGISAQDLQSSFFPFPFKEPSQTLVGLRGIVKDEAMQLASSADLKGAMSANAPAATTLAMMQQAQQGMGAILLRVYRSMSNEFKKIFYLEAEYANPDEYKSIVEDDQADFYKDFDIKISKICPNANPDFSSKVQRLQAAQAAMSQVPVLWQIPGVNVKAIIREYYKALGANYSDEVAPQEQPQEILQKLLMENPDLQELIMNEKERQGLLVEAQLQADEMQKQRDTIAFGLEMAIKKQEERKIAAEVRAKNAGVVLTLEKAETEQVANQITIYDKTLNNENEVNNVTTNA
jgi:chaperonin GroES